MKELNIKEGKPKTYIMAVCSTKKDQKFFLRAEAAGS